MVNSVVRWVRGVWPTVCVLCRGRGAPGVDLCAGCQADLPRNTPACARCACQLAGPTGAPLCGGCLKRPPFFHGAFAPFRYGYPLDHLIQGLKFRGRLPCGRVLGTLLAEHLRERNRDLLPQIIIPTPLSYRRYVRRGFNQASELARPVGAALGLPICRDVIVRARETQEQSSLPRAERRRNVRGAFELVRALPAPRIAIIDDVITTGSTANELAKVLRRAGAEHVEVWTIARA